MSVAWSPSNHLAASIASLKVDSLSVQVWDASFRTIFKLQQEGARQTNGGVVFASNDLLISSGCVSNQVYWYHMSKPKVMNVFMETNVFPFCRDVTNIIIAYLPLVTHVTHDIHPKRVGDVMALSSQLVVSSCDDLMLRVFKVDGTEHCLLGSFPIRRESKCMEVCMYPIEQNHGFMLASAIIKANYTGSVDVSVTVSQVCIPVMSRFFFVVLL